MSPHDPDDMLRQPLLAHLIELRSRLIWCLAAIGIGFCVSYYFAADIYAILVRPLADAMHGEGRKLIYTGLAEAFVTYIKLALWTACFLAFPLIAVQIWRFCAPGLFAHEKRAFWPFLAATPLLFALGAAMAYFVVMPVAWKFFLSFENNSAGGMPIQLEARVSEYLSIAMMLIFSFGAAFELPVLLVLLVRVGVLSVEQLVNFRRFAVVAIFVIAAVITPPDVLSQLLLALPLWGLYEISIVAARWMKAVERKQPD
ncbi:MAG: twin-arginine translocase subunit TatC [Alphaproteobacteria bacterium]